MSLPMNLQKGERVISVVRRHPVFLIGRLAVVVFAVAVPAGVALAVGLSSQSVPVLIAGAAWLTGWLIVAYLMWYRYVNDLWILTNQRLIDSVKRNWFHHELSSADLINVEDINLVRSGCLATLFNFGDVRCQTAGTQENFVLSSIPNPADVLDLIDETRDAARRAVLGRENLIR